jgi:hypothetical protein
MRSLFRPHADVGPRSLALALAAVLVATSAAGAPPKPKPGAKAEPGDVETAEQLYTKLDYDRANELAERLTKSRNLTHDQLVRAWRVLAVTNAILDKEEAARDAFLQLLVFDPEYTVDAALGPKVSTPFVEARGQFRSLPSKPGIDVIANVRSDGGQLRVTLRDPTRIAKRVSVGWRWTSSGDYVVSQLPPSDGTVEVAAATGGRTRLDFYAQAVDERDNAVFEAGNAQVPKSAFAEPGPKPPPAAGTTAKPASSGSVFSSPIFWVAAGVVAVGGGTALLLAVRPEDPPTRALLNPVIRCGPEICK